MELFSYAEGYLDLLCCHKSVIHTENHHSTSRHGPEHIKMDILRLRGGGFPGMLGAYTRPLLGEKDFRASILEAASSNMHDNGNIIERVNGSVRNSTKDQLRMRDNAIKVARKEKRVIYRQDTEETTPTEDEEDDYLSDESEEEVPPRKKTKTTVIFKDRHKKKEAPIARKRGGQRKHKYSEQARKFFGR